MEIQEEDTLCVLHIEKVNEREHAGNWIVTVYGESCDKSRKKRQAEGLGEPTDTDTDTPLEPRAAAGASLTVKNSGDLGCKPQARYRVKDIMIMINLFQL